MEVIDRAFNQRYGPKNGDFNIWIDCQIRPTIGTTVREGLGGNRPEISSETFTAMLQTLITTIDELIPQYRADVYFSYSMGRWQRLPRFHLKAHLTPEAFLSLVDRFCEENSLGTNPLHQEEQIRELEKRHKMIHHGKQVREFFSIEKCEDQKKGAKFHVATVSKLDYPLLRLYHTNNEDKTKSTAIAASQLPDALPVLESFVAEDWRQDGYSIGMVYTPDSVPGVSPMCYQVVAVINSEDFARIMRKDKSVVKTSWGWHWPDRKHHRNFDIGHSVDERPSGWKKQKFSHLRRNRRYTS